MTGRENGENTKLSGVLIHPAAALHDPGWGHPEHQGRMRFLSSAVSRDMLALHDRVAQMETRSATKEVPGTRRLLSGVGCEPIANDQLPGR
jgi:hypothetical protein